MNERIASTERFDYKCDDLRITLRIPALSGRALGKVCAALEAEGEGGRVESTWVDVQKRRCCMQNLRGLSLLSSLATLLPYFRNFYIIHNIYLFLREFLMHSERILIKCKGRKFEDTAASRYRFALYKDFCHFNRVTMFLKYFLELPRKLNFAFVDSALTRILIRGEMSRENVEIFVEKNVLFATVLPRIEANRVFHEGRAGFLAFSFRASPAETSREAAGGAGDFPQWRTRWRTRVGQRARASPSDHLRRVSRGRRAL